MSSTTNTRQTAAQNEPKYSESQMMLAMVLSTLNGVFLYFAGWMLYKSTIGTKDVEAERTPFVWVFTFIGPLCIIIVATAVFIWRLVNKLK